MNATMARRFLRRWLQLGLVIEIVIVGAWTFKRVETEDVILTSAICWAATALLAAIDVLMNEDRGA